MLIITLMKKKIALLLFLALASALHGQDRHFCLFQFQSIEQEFKQLASVDIIRDYVVNRGFNPAHIIAWSDDDKNNIFIIVKVEKIEESEAPVGRIDEFFDESFTNYVKPSHRHDIPGGIQDTAQWFMHLTDRMHYRFNPNLSLLRIRFQYLNGQKIKVITDS
jgi:hypothetical protein